nr:hypothetical protein [uncultured Lacibacter sp.]
MNRIIIYAFMVISSSCYYDAADLLYPGSAACDTTATSYSQKVVPLLQQRCYSCHLNVATGGGVMMGNYTADKTLATNGKLYGSISHSSGYSPMPKGAAKMTSCQIAVIKQWIDAGTPAN